MCPGGVKHPRPCQIETPFLHLNFQVIGYDINSNYHRLRQLRKVFRKSFVPWSRYGGIFIKFLKFVFLIARPLREVKRLDP